MNKLAYIGQLSFALMCMSCVFLQVNTVPAPEGTIPSRLELPYEAFGAYISVYDSGGSMYSGEFIGLTGDSIVVLGETLSIIYANDIATARVIYFAPEDQTPGIFWVLPNFLMLGAQCDDCSGQELAAVAGAVQNLAAYVNAASIEKNMINHVDLAAGNWLELRKFARFPYDIPSAVNLSALRRRPGGKAKDAE